MDTAPNKYYISTLIIIITTSLFFTDATDTISTSQILSDTISTSQILSDNDDGTLLSSRGTFELGFFSPGNSSTNRYVGIWYKNITPRVVVWVANRDNPLVDRSGTLRFNETGQLVLLNATNGSIKWFTDYPTSVRSPVAQLLDSGNLVVREADEERFAWQSFNYPTDTFLPEMNLGKNLVTGQEFSLTSWRSSSDPSRGEFVCSFDPSGYPQLLTRRNGNVIYRMGPWNGIAYSGLPDLQRNTFVTLSAVVNNNETYYRYRVNDDSLIVRITLSEAGVGRRWVWSGEKQGWTGDLSVPIDDCDNFEACGANGMCNIKNNPICECLSKFKPNDPTAWAVGETSSGCNRTTPLDCQKGDGFLKYSGIKLPDTQSSWFDETMDLKECKDACSRNCNCSAYTSLNISEGGSGCLIWFGDLMDIRDMTPGQDIYIRVASSELDSNGKKRKILIVALSLVAGILVLILFLLYSCKRKKLDQDLLPEDYYDGQGGEDLDVPMFDFSSIIKATDNFSDDNKLGEGGFGPVYKGLLEDGQMIAVKRLSGNSDQGVDEFKNEVICIAELRHRNLVKLVGYCIRGKEMMLVYEYLKNKSLDFILFDPTKGMLLDWPRRFNIINGIARGLMYLHQDSHLRVIHRDLKTSNILLDSDMNPKISDFGLARTFGGNETGANTNRIVGTYGYMSPEYAGDGVFSVKSDVFSFGVIVLEIVSGRRNRRFSFRDQRLNLLGYAWVLNKEENSLELVDPCLGDSINVPQVVRSIHVGLLCVQEHPDDRPTMSSVVQMLSNDAMILPQPKHPGFFIQRDAAETKISATSSTGSSANVITNTVLQGR